jgi:hypothetical protein
MVLRTLCVTKMHNCFEGLFSDIVILDRQLGQGIGTGSR